MNAASDFIASLRMPEGRPFRILQFADIHLMANGEDELTLGLIVDMARALAPDLVFFTGDQTMCPETMALYPLLAGTMSSLGIPWTFVYGNHDGEHGVTRKMLADVVAGTPGLVFGLRGDVSDFCIELTNCEGEPKWLVFGLDTRNDAFYDLPGGRTWGYDTVHPEQIAWYGDVVRRHLRGGRPLPNVVFQHIPPLATKTFVKTPGASIVGEKNEGVCSAPIDFGESDALAANGAKAVFYGHDHVNDFAFVLDGVLYAYGRVSGRHDYAMPGFPKGARAIDLGHDGSVRTAVLLHRDLPELRFRNDLTL
jgi:3',5'-cyclic AMP phosphodiesterase CpdA